MSIKTGIIGLGKIGSQWDEGVSGRLPRTHVGAVLQAKKFQLCAVCDTNAANRAKFAEDWKLPVPIYDSISKMLEKESLDVISVAVPTVAHYPVLKEVVKSGPKVVFCEKPFCCNVREANEIYKLSKERNATLSVHYHRRWDGKIRKLKTRTDAMGRPCHVDIIYRKGLLNYGSHIVNLLLYLFGPVESVSGMPLSAGQQKAADPSFSAILNFRSGLQAAMKEL